MTGDYNIVYKSDSPAGAHNKIGVDPLFKDTAAGDFHLKAGSPAIDAGTVVPVATDFDGNVRPINGAFDIGAFEFSNAAVKGDRSESHGPALQRDYGRQSCYCGAFYAAFCAITTPWCFSIARASASVPGRLTEVIFM